MKKVITFIILIILLGISTTLIFDWGRGSVEAPVVINNQDFILSTSTEDLPIIVDYPKEQDEVTSPFTITGKARGYWFFEADFPIQLVDSDGNHIANAIGQAQTDWMTTDFVDFKAEISYPKPETSKPAFLILSKDNPSDIPELDQSIFIPIILK
jgi:hypothetical protein